MLDIGETWTYGASYTATQANINAGTALVNRVSVTSTQTPKPVTASATTAVTLGPSLSVSKTTPSTSIGAPGTIHYTIVVTNTGNVAVTDLHLVDVMPDGSSGALAFVSGDSDGDGVLDIGEAWTYTASFAVGPELVAAGGQLVNTVTVTSRQTTSAVSATASTAVAGGPPPAAVPVPALDRRMLIALLIGLCGLAAAVTEGRRRR